MVIMGSHRSPARRSSWSLTSELSPSPVECLERLSSMRLLSLCIWTNCRVLNRAPCVTRCCSRARRMCLTYLIIPCSGIYFYGNTITSFAGTTFDCKYCEWVPLPHRVPPTADHLMLLLCIPASCASSVSGSVAAALTCLMMRRSELDFDDNEITSLAGATFAGEIE